MTASSPVPARESSRLTARLRIALVLLVVGVMALGGLWLVEHRKRAEMESAIATLRSEKDRTSAQVGELEAKLTDLQKRAAEVTAAAELVRAQSTKAGGVSVPAAAIPQPKARPGVTTTPPAGWRKNGSKPGSYVVGVDANETWGGMPSAYVESLESSVDGFGGMMQATSAEAYLGKRVRLSGWIKTEGANAGGGHLWLRVDGNSGVLQFDNMSNRAARGTTDWQEASVVLDVPEQASALAFGMFVEGAGKMWVNGTKIEVVGADVPTTNMPKPRTLPKAPTNLGFAPGETKG